jgi:glutamate 5-kinase
MLQAAAAIGQPALMSLYERLFTKYGLHAGQVLVTRHDFEQRSRYLNISNTLNALNAMGAIPIINENDTTAVDELDKFADNDTISALVTNLLRADLLVILSVVDGVLNEKGQRVDFVERIAQVLPLIKKDKSTLGSGGMAGKLGAARLVTDAGEAVVIANGREPNVLLKLLDGRRVGTIFAPAPRKMSARHRWMRGAVSPAGRITIDHGAAEALLSNGKSLLARGITEVSGSFGRGAIVRIVTTDGETIAHGISNYGRTELDKIKGLKSGDIAAALGSKPFDETVHRDNLVLISGK